jgi:hypothetical protein
MIIIYLKFKLIVGQTFPHKILNFLCCTNFLIYLSEEKMKGMISKNEKKEGFDLRLFVWSHTWD